MKGLTEVHQSQLPFFMMPDESRTWLTTLLVGDVYCLINRLTNHSYAEIETSGLRRLDFIASRLTYRLYLGRKDLAPQPVWRQAGNRKELDFVRSQMIQIQPCFQSGSTLLLGQLAIMKVRDYEQAAVPYVDLVAWFSLVRRSLRQVVSGSLKRLWSNLPGEVAKPSKQRVFVSPGVNRWWQNGGKLKQFGESTVELALRDSHV
jgi:hypothetical protein